MCVCACSECTSAWLSSYLAGGDELERPEGGLHVRDVGLELVERSRDAGLDLRGLGPRGAVGRDLVEGLLRHDGRLRYRYPGRRRASRESAMFALLYHFSKLWPFLGALAGWPEAPISFRLNLTLEALVLDGSPIRCSHVCQA